MTRSRSRRVSRRAATTIETQQLRRWTCHDILVLTERLVKIGLCYRDAAMSRILTVVAAQVRPVPFDPAATLQKFEEEVRMLRGGFPDADLYIFPELYLTGEHPFVRAPSGYDENAQPIPGPLTRAIGRIAKRAGRWIVAGSIVEQVGDSRYNTAVVFGRPAGWSPGTARSSRGGRSSRTRSAPMRRRCSRSRTSARSA